MPAGRFGLYTLLGCIPWTAALGIAGYALGANWQSVANGFHGVATPALLLKDRLSSSLQLVVSGGI